MLDRLSAAEAREALALPARAQGVDWDPQAIRFAAASADGYPYFLQEFGMACWETAIGRRISLAAATDGVTRGWARLDAGFFRSRWDRATADERKYMQAMSCFGGDMATTQEVAQALGKKTRGLAPVRSSLIRKGFVYAPEVGKVSFTVPGVPGFIQRLERAR